MTDDAGTTLAYLAAAVLFIFGIRLLRRPQTARTGNIVAAVGMGIAVLVTLFEVSLGDLWAIALAAGVGTAVGAVSAQRVQMTAMPQMVGAFNGGGGGAAALIGFSELYQLDQAGGGGEFVVVLTSLLSVLIGSVSFAGSAVAFLKLQELALTGSVRFPGQGLTNALLFAVSLALGALALTTEGGEAAFATPLLAVALVLGVLVVIPIGGADMPIVISLLNAFTGLAAAFSGFVLENDVLIIAGSLVGASGTILTYLMSAALNRPLQTILFSAVSAAAPAGEEEEERPVRSVQADDVAALLDHQADKVIFVPGYGLAVAQAQKAMADLATQLEQKGKEVKFAIHPVAGRMPGHMNVLLAEAEVPPEKLVDMEDINDEFPETDVVVVVGANDVVNPRAREDSGSPISGMPILNVDEAKNVVFVKRSLSPGFAGIDNPLFYDLDETMMFFSDAKQGLEQVVAAVKRE
jgi:NAD(P) transhydrogenase subunit beta